MLPIQIFVDNMCVFKNITTSLSYLNLLKLIIDPSKLHYSLNTKWLTCKYFNSSFQVACNKDCIAFNPMKRYWVINWQTAKALASILNLNYFCLLLSASDHQLGKSDTHTLKEKVKEHLVEEPKC